jgi:hypothetical protein
MPKRRTLEMKIVPNESTGPTLASCRAGAAPSLARITSTFGPPK